MCRPICFIACIYYHVQFLPPYSSTPTVAFDSTFTQNSASQGFSPRSLQRPSRSLSTDHRRPTQGRGTCLDLIKTWLRMMRFLSTTTENSYSNTDILLLTPQEYSTFNPQERKREHCPSQKASLVLHGTSVVQRPPRSNSQMQRCTVQISRFA